MLPKVQKLTTRFGNDTREYRTMSTGGAMSCHQKGNNRVDHGKMFTSTRSDTPEIRTISVIKMKDSEIREKQSYVKYEEKNKTYSYKNWKWGGGRRVYFTKLHMGGLTSMKSVK